MNKYSQQPIPSPMCGVSMKLEQMCLFYAGPTKKLKHPTGSPCEVKGCGKLSVWNLKRREYRDGPLGGSTQFDPKSPEHPRCLDHLHPGDAWTIDGMER